MRSWRACRSGTAACRSRLGVAHGVARAGLAGATCAPCSSTGASALQVAWCSVRSPERSGRGRWWPSRPSRWSWSDPRRAGRRQAWLYPPFSTGGGRSWRRASSPTSSATRWRAGVPAVGCGASIRLVPLASRRARGRRSRAVPTGDTPPGWRPTCVRRREPTGRRPTASSGMPPRRSCCRPFFSPRAADGRSMADVVRWVDTQEADEVADALERAGVPEALDAARATWGRDERTRSSVYTTAETVLAPFAESPPAWSRPRRSRRDTCSAAPTPCTCARPHTTSDDYAGISGRSCRRCCPMPSRWRHAPEAR